MSPLYGSNEFRALHCALFDLKDTCCRALGPGERVQDGFSQLIVLPVNTSKFFPCDSASTILKTNRRAGVKQ
jgi:hypothetical protein